MFQKINVFLKKKFEVVVVFKFEICLLVNLSLFDNNIDVGIWLQKQFIFC